jgi:hypothetical protein
MQALIDGAFQARFGAFPVVHEIETWLLADAPNTLGSAVAMAYPEQIVHPAEYLRQYYEEKKQRYHKLATGRELFRKADARRVFDDNCPHFRLLAGWLRTPPEATPRTPSPSSQRRQQIGVKIVELQAELAVVNDFLDQPSQDDPSYEEKWYTTVDRQHQLEQQLQELNEEYNKPL